MTDRPSSAKSEPFLTGYTDWPAYDPGDGVALHLSGAGEVEIELVRLRHGDTAATGPGLRYETVAGVGARSRLQPRAIHTGSCLIVDRLALATEDIGWSFSTWIFVTAYPATNSTILAIDAPDGRARLELDRHGAVHFTPATGAEGNQDERSGAVRLIRRQWYLVALVTDANQSGVEIVAHNQVTATAARARQHGGSRPLLDHRATAVTFAATRDREVITGAFDGKLDSPAFWGSSLSADQIAALAVDRVPDVEPLLAWNFAERQHSLTVVERRRGADGRLINLPARAMTGHAWRGIDDDWRRVPDEYAAIHFHRDDLADAAWPVSATLDLPPELDNGVYAARVSNENGNLDLVPFVVRREASASQRPLAVLLPTFTYLAYANETIFEPHVPLVKSPTDDWSARQRLRSQYNYHDDGSGVIHASLLRPLPNLRPDYRYWLTGHPHGLGADLYLLDWLEHSEIPFDVITDHDLDLQGAALLDGYRALITGAHPEYWSRASVGALTAFLKYGGRFVYAGGNGFGAYIGVHSEMPGATEMRRLTPGLGMWDSEPGEARLASTGELGGHGRHHKPRGRDITGVDISAMGFADAVGFTRTAHSRDPRVAFAFDGIGEGVLGDFGLHMGGAAGYEVDAADFRAGTPPHALIVATADQFDSYAYTDSRGERRADMTFFETAAGGAVFSFSSITWSGSLSHNDYDNDVSRLTRNVLMRFLDPTPFSLVDPS